jgi:hypothetical protein
MPVDLVYAGGIGQWRVDRVEVVTIARHLEHDGSGFIKKHLRAIGPALGTESIGEQGRGAIRQDPVAPVERAVAHEPDIDVQGPPNVLVDQGCVLIDVGNANLTGSESQVRS